MKIEEIRLLPKIDLHCHLDGSLDVRMVRDMLQRQGEHHETEELQAKMEAPADCGSLAEYLDCFSLPISCLQTEDALRIHAYAVARDAAEEGVKYLEVRFAPDFHREGGLTVQEVIAAVREGLTDAARATGIRCGIIVCGMRGMEVSENIRMLEEASVFAGDGLVGCDLAGNEAAFPTKVYADYFLRAADLDIPCTIHAGECGDPKNIEDAIGLGASRIGHGVAMAGDPVLQAKVRAVGAGIEMSPSSNLQTKAIAGWEEFPLYEFLNAGLRVAVCTDNRTVSRTNSTVELLRISRNLGLERETYNRIYRDSVHMAFAPEPVKEWLLDQLRGGGR